ncbi:MAG: isoprenylcysteine carboxylmethyltransferase family protein [Actinobacteria bacterium]|nr:isoprenylcysteine carboxylmethyltransferase family protein [Actinomycetota bacterium]
MRYKEFFFTYRSYTPIPVILIALILARPSLASFIFGLLIAMSGESIRIWSIRYAGSATRTTGEVGADELVTTGPYGHLRNPLYLGNFLLSFGVLIMAWPWMPWFLLLYLLLFYFQYSAIISLEEDFLRKKFGAVYSEYEKHVPRFIPRFSNWGEGKRKPTGLAKALRTERNSLQSLSIVTILLIFRWIFL